MIFESYCCTASGDALQRGGAQHAHLSTYGYRRQFNWSGEGRTYAHMYFQTHRNKQDKDKTNNSFCVHPQLEKELTYENFVDWTNPDMMDKVEVQVGLPRFKMEEKYDMKDVLVSMGMVDAFDMAMSDFSGRTCNWTTSGMLIIF